MTIEYESRSPYLSFVLDRSLAWATHILIGHFLCRLVIYIEGLWPRSITTICVSGSHREVLSFGRVVTRTRSRRYLSSGGVGFRRVFIVSNYVALIQNVNSWKFRQNKCIFVIKSLPVDGLHSTDKFGSLILWDLHIKINTFYFAQTYPPLRNC